MPYVKKVSLQKNTFGYGFALRSERPCVVDVVMPDSVAAAANVTSGDALLTVNGVDVSNMPHSDVASLIWSAGSTIRIEKIGMKIAKEPAFVDSIKNALR
ncbi:unnamed protein product [Echinostoma caproni]|uniref:PDZ domain-containing protein n=1 Tax=Echinostoma caproni TaxID=27848 RepID=A0A183BG92_9TREM|nr:unnamed protein product [Echinostoma caproni]